MGTTQDILSAYHNGARSVKSIMKRTGCSWNKIVKTLSDNNIIINDKQRDIVDLFNLGYSIEQIAPKTKLSEKTVRSYTPRVRPVYMENRSKNALTIEKCRKNKNKTDV